MAKLDQHIHVEKVHATQHDDDQANFCTEKLYRFHCISRLGAVAQRQRDKANVDQIEADQEQVVDRIRQGFPPLEILNQEDAAVLVEAASHPNGDSKTEDHVDTIGDDHHCVS